MLKKQITGPTKLKNVQEVLRTFNYRHISIQKYRIFLNWLWKRGTWGILENDHYWTSMLPISHSNAYYWTSMPSISHFNSSYWTSMPILSQSEKLLYVLSHLAGLLSRKNYNFWEFWTCIFWKNQHFLKFGEFSNNGSSGQTTMLTTSAAKFYVEPWSPFQIPLTTTAKP